MASIIKNQILKHLSRFTKNLSPDKIQLSTFKGEGSLNNLELNEQVLMELLDLPTWLRLVTATCNKVSIKVPWTKLKSQAICLYLDEVVVDMETCPEPRSPIETSSGMPSHSSGGKYGFADRVIDGMFVSVNSVIVNFKSTAFQASIQLSRLKVQSVNPLWKVVNDLRMTRIRDPDRGMLLTFKEIEWQTLRVEANAIVTDDPTLATTPLRLISNASRLRLVLRKKLADCSVLASKLSFILDDLLWVLTDSQMKAAIAFSKSLQGIIKKSAEQSKDLAAIKLQKQVSTSSASSHPDLVMPANHHHHSSNNQTKVAQLFSRFDVIETSYHLYTGRIDLHICDEIGPNATSSCHSQLVDGGAIQITFHKFSFEHYPYHPAGGSRKHWCNYNENMAARNDWASKLMADFRKKIKTVTSASPSTAASPEQSPQHTASSIPVQGSRQQSPGLGQHTNQPPTKPRLTKMIERCFIVRLEDFTMFRVSTSDNTRNIPKKFLSSDKKSLYLPPEMSAFHVEYTDYFFPSSISYPVPHGNLYAMVNPVRLAVDYLTVLWLNAFSLGMALNISMPEAAEPANHIDIKIEALMPRLILPSDEDSSHEDHPNGLQIQASKVVITNCRIDESSSVSQLDQVLDNLNDQPLFVNQSPQSQQHSLIFVPDNFKEHVERERNVATILSDRGDVDNKMPGLDQDSLKLKAYLDVWCVCAEQFWVDFVETSSLGRRPAPFVESFPVAVWICLPARQHQHTRTLSRLKGGAFMEEGQSHTVEVTPGSPDRQRNRNLLKNYYCTDGGCDDAQGACDVKDANSNGAHIEKKKTCDSRGGDRDGESSYGNTTLSPSELTSKHVADVQVLISVKNLVQCQLNHFQYLFVLRLAKTLTNFQKNLDADTLAINPTSKSSLRMGMALAAQELSLSLVSPLDLGSKFTVDNTVELSSPGEVSDIPVDLTEVTCPLSPMHGLTPLIVHPNSDADDLNNTLTSTVEHCQDVQPASSVPLESPILPDGAMPLKTGQVAPLGFSSDQSSGVVSTCVNTASKTELVSGFVRSPSFDSGIDGSHSPKSRPLSLQSIQKAVSKNKSLSDFKSSALSKFDNLFNRNSAGGDDDGSDTMSLHSSVSDEDEEFVLVGLESQSETSVSTIESTSSSKDVEVTSINSLSSSQGKNKGKVSVITFNVAGIQTGIQILGPDTTLTLHGSRVIPIHRGKIYMEELYDHTVASSLAYEYSPPNLSSAPLQVDFKIGPAADLIVEGAGGRGHLDVKVDDLSLHLMMSSVMNMAKLFEDETISEAVPIRVVVTNVKLRLEDDRLPANSSLPRPVPINVHVHKNVVIRTLDGTFHVSAGVEGVGAEQSFSNLCNLESQVQSLCDEKLLLHKSLERLETENESLEKTVSELRNSLSQVESSLTENTSQQTDDMIENTSTNHLDNSSDDKERGISVERFELVAKENDMLNASILMKNEEIEHLRCERDSLMATLQLLQEELIQSEQNRVHPNS